MSADHNSVKVGGIDSSEPMEADITDYNTNMRAKDPLFPTLPQNPVSQEMKDLLLSEKTVSESVVSSNFVPDEAIDDPSRSSGLLDFIFENIEDPRKVEINNECRLLSSPFMIRCLPWKILLVFSRPDTRPSMGMFLQCNADCPSSTWTCFARARMELISQTSVPNKKLNIRHTFNAKENDWGYQSFLTYNELFSPENGFVVNKCIHARISVDADAPHGADWDSKRFTGFVGLKNQGATCYLNSVLQALYFTNRLRSAVFRMPTESDDSQTSVPLALQRTFFELQCSDQSIGTEKLTRSFGWATLDSFMQHDAQELCRVLLDNIENKMKGTNVEDVIPKLFCGQMVSYIKCKNVNYESTRNETFYDIQLKVKGNRNINEAFKEYIEKETLANENKYDAGKYGLQEAEKGVTFVKFPPVLYLQLMRFQYDFHSNTNVKINDRFEFPYYLDLKEYVVDPADAGHTQYFLHAVLVHSGDQHGGHYVVYINPLGDNTWYQFDDDVVSRCTPRDAIEMNYGNSDDPDIRACTNAYMLVYIANDARDEILFPVTEADIPASLKNRFLDEQSLEERKRKEKDCAHEYTFVNILLEEDFNGYEGVEICRPELLPLRSVRVRRGINGVQLIAAVSEVLKCSPNSIRLWQLTQRDRNSIALEFHQPKNFDLYRDSTLIFWAQPLPPRENIGSFESLQIGRLFFFKYFDPISCTLSYCGYFELNQLMPMNCLLSTLRLRAGLPIDTGLIFFKESNNRGVILFDFNTLLSTLARTATQGEIIFFQVDPRSPFLTHRLALSSEETGHDALNILGPTLDSELSTDATLPASFAVLRRLSFTSSSVHVDDEPVPFIDYYSSRINQVEILLVDKLRKSDPGVLIRLSPNLDYKSFSRLIANYLSVQPNKLQFFASQPISSLHQGHQGGMMGSMGNDSAIGGNKMAGVNLVGSPVGSDLTGGNTCYSPTSASNLISAQSIAAKASGFISASPQLVSTLSAIAHQGLLKEPPGRPILSTVSGTVKDFLHLQIPPFPIQAQSPTANSALSNTATPQILSRYLSQSSVLASPFGNLNLSPPHRVYYAHIALPIDKLESLKQFQISFVGPRLSARLDLSLSVPKNGTVADLLAEARPRVSLTGSGKLRLLEIRDNQIVRMHQDDSLLDKIDPAVASLTFDSNDNPKNGLRIEEVPLDELNLQNNETIIFAAHFDRDITETFGVPFIVRLRDGELYSALKERIRKRLDVSVKEFLGWNLILVTKSKSVLIPNDDGVEVQIGIFTSNPLAKPWLGIQHKPYRRHRYAPSEKPIKIHN